MDKEIEFTERLTKNLLFKKRDPKKPDFDNEDWFALCCLLIFFGNEAMKVVFRTNFGKKAIIVPFIILANVAFLGISFICFNKFINQDDNNTIFLFISLFYFLFTILVTIKSIKEYKIATISLNDDEYQGDSQLLKSFVKDGANQSTVQNFIEPSIICILGGCLWLINIWAGLPLLCCGVSMWFNLFISKYILGKDIINKKQELIKQSLNEKKFNKVKRPKL